MKLKKDKIKKLKSNAEKPISLKPLKFDEAVSDLLQVKPEFDDVCKICGKKLLQDVKGKWEHFDSKISDHKPMPK